MADAVIKNPMINSPFKESGRHFRFSDEGIANEVVESHRLNSYGGFGRWAFVEVTDPYVVRNLVRSMLSTLGEKEEMLS